MLFFLHGTRWALVCSSNRLNFIFTPRWVLWRRSNATECIEFRFYIINSSLHLRFNRITCNTCFSLTMVQASSVSVYWFSPTFSIPLNGTAWILRNRSRANAKCANCKSFLRGKKKQKNKKEKQVFDPSREFCVARVSISSDVVQRRKQNKFVYLSTQSNGSF